MSPIYLADLGGPGQCAATYRTGPFRVSLQTDFAPLRQLRETLYPGTSEAPDLDLIDFHVRMQRPHSARRWIKPTIHFFLDQVAPFEPYPLDHAFPLLEWGLNWCIATQAHQYLMLHAAVVERNGRALMLPALPGSGKSTLCAALAHRDWRLLSDEFGLILPATLQVLPLPRAIPLKNESIEIIRRFLPEAHLGPVFPNTRKGTVAHLRPPGDSLPRQQEAAEPRWILFPRYLSGHAPRIQPIPSALAFTRLAHNSFNYRLLGATGFRALVALVQQCDCYSLEYGNLHDAIAAIEQTLFG